MEIENEERGIEQTDWTQERVATVLNNARETLTVAERIRRELTWETANESLDRLPSHPMVDRVAKPDLIRQACTNIRGDLENDGIFLPDRDVDIPVKDFIDYLNALQLQMKENPLERPAIRPIVCPEPGELPFKHDPVQRYHDYHAEWVKHPAPGEQKRLQLRWKVREYMMHRVDLPVLEKQ